YRASPFDGTTPLADVNNFSRAVEYSIDETSMEIQQVWEYGPQREEPLYAGFIGDVDWMQSTGNVKVTFGGVSVIDGVPAPDFGYGTVMARIVEVPHVPQPQAVFELMVYDPTGPNARTQVYRSEHLHSLYGEDVTVEEFAGGVPDGPNGAPL